jgi:hypothetical protein
MAMATSIRLLPLALLLLALLPLASVAHANGRAIDPATRMQLVHEAASKAGLQEVGLNYRDLYGVIHAETGWTPRDGIGKNGVVSHGLAQFEPATARAVGLRNPNDPKQAVEAAAVLLREAAQWSARKLQGAHLSSAEWQRRLREGISVYYTLSTRTRSEWDGLNSDSMPAETRRHIHNARQGASIAGRLEGSLHARAPSVEGRCSPATVRTREGLLLSLGSIAWSC